MILDAIVVRRRQDMERTRRVPDRLIRTMIAEKPPVRDFAAALKRKGEVCVIAEIKRASPIKGVLRADLDHRWFAQTYEEAGAAAISVLTEKHFFQGSIHDMRQVHALVDIPVLRKDFIIDGYQVLEARANDADAILLIAAILDQRELNHLQAMAESVGIATLVEVHTPEEAERALAAEATVIGINNRNLEDFTVDLETTERLMGYLPAGCTVVSESGIRSADDIRRLREWGVNAVLVGEALVTADDPLAALAELVQAGRAARV
ncbi:MAG TPA: indole-3-glycerol phosphate synthase TrpC [Chloroflexota bacterium]